MKKNTSRNNIPVEKYIDILLSISNTKLGVNQIVKHTGMRYKNSTISAIKKLKKEGIIKQVKDPSHDQRDITQPTSLGEEILSLIEDVKELQKLYKKLYSNKIFEILKKPVESRRGLLRNIGWDTDDINKIKDTLQGLVILQIYVLYDISSIVDSRFVQILSKYSVGQISTSILKKISLDVISFKIQELKKYNEDRSQIQIDNVSIPINIIKHFQELSVNRQLDFTEKFYFHFPDTISDEVKDLIIQYFKFVKPPPEKIQKLQNEEERSNTHKRIIKKIEYRLNLRELFFNYITHEKQQNIINIFFSIMYNAAQQEEKEPDEKLIRDIYNSLTQ